MKSRSPLFLIFLTIFIDLLGFGIVIPILAYIGDEYASGEYRGVKIALMMTLYSLFQMIFSPIMGRMSDRIGRRPIILISLAGSTASYVIFAFSRSFTLLLLSRVLAGIFGANITAAQAYIADVTPKEKRTASMGLIGMAFGLGFAIGPVFGAGLAWLGTRAFPDYAAAEQTLPGLGAAAICLLNLIFAIRLLPESLPKEKRAEVVPTRRLANPKVFFASLGNKVIAPLVGVFFFATFAFSAMEMALSVYLKRTEGLTFETRGVYGIFIYIGLLLTIMNGYVVRKAVKFVPETILVIVGTAAQAVGLLLFPVFPNLTCILVAMGILAFGQGLAVPSLLGLVSKATSASRQGEVLGVTQSASSLARIVGPMFAGLMWATFGLSWPFYAGGVVMLGATVMAVITRRRLIQYAPVDGAPEEPAVSEA